MPTMGQLDSCPKSPPYARSTGKRSARPASLKSRSTGGESTSRARQHTDAQENMAASFLQYCAMCEKQIMTPCNSILYCSAACRRKDANKPLSASIISSSSAPSSPPPSMPATPLVQATSPKYTDVPAVRIPSDNHNAKSDLDPTEWKPKLQHRAHSEAFRYLSQFHRTMNDMNNNESVKTERPRLTHKSTTSTTTAMTTPSLGNSPVTAASSFESAYNFNTRPLAPRQNPYYSAGGKGMDLVTPHIPPPAELAISPIESQQWMWEKRTVTKGSAGRDGLGSLFGSMK